MKVSELRKKAWDSLVGNYWPAVLTAFVAAIFGALVVNIGSLNFDFSQEDLELFKTLPGVIKLCLSMFGVAASAFSFVHLILGGVIQLGYTQYLLKQQDREVTNVKELFTQFDRFGQGFLQMFLRGLFTTLWALLFIIPGIIKGFAYAMTPFIMAENPEMTAKEAIRRSSELMKGHKWELFCLGFSFIGWYLLCALTLGIGTIFLNPYVNAAYAAFYRDKISPKTATTYIYQEPPVLE